MQQHRPLPSMASRLATWAAALAAAAPAGRLQVTGAVLPADSSAMLQQQLEMRATSPVLPPKAALAGATNLARREGRAEANATRTHIQAKTRLPGTWKELECTAIETAMQQLVKHKCKVNKKVICVWGDTDVCNVQDTCVHVSQGIRGIMTPLLMRSQSKPGTHCGYIPDNAFLKFSEYSCEVRQMLPLNGSLSCSVSLTPVAVAICIAACLAAAGGCCGLGYYCFVGRRKLKGGLPQISSDLRIKLLSAAQMGDLRAVERALEAGAEVDTRSPANATPLISAAQFGHREVVTLLLQKGADPHLATNAGNTALLVAVLRGHFDVAELLLRAGADPRARNRTGLSAMDVPGTMAILEHDGRSGGH